MIVLLSPAKSLDLTRVAQTPRATKPRCLLESSALVEKLKTLSPARLARLMGISDDLARLNHERFQSWQLPFTVKNARKAILTFDGDVYKGLDIDRYDLDDFAFAQGTVRILSGLYGVLRPLDLMQPYRLEMGTPLGVDGARDLYEFWGETPTALIRKDLRDHAEPVIVNLASDEYFKVIRQEALGSIRVVKPVFKEKRKGGYKVMSFFAKKARGLMADDIVKRRVESVAGLAEFKGAGYRYDKTLSTDEEWVFTRTEAAAAKASSVFAGR